MISYTICQVGMNGKAGRELGTVDFRDPLGVVPWSQLLQIQDVEFVHTQYGLHMDWNTMELRAHTGSAGPISFFAFFPIEMKPKKEIPNVVYCSTCNIKLHWVRATLCCPTCKKVFGGIQ